MTWIATHAMALSRGASKSAVSAGRPFCRTWAIFGDAADGPAPPATAGGGRAKSVYRGGGVMPSKIPMPGSGRQAAHGEKVDRQVAGALRGEVGEGLADDAGELEAVAREAAGDDNAVVVRVAIEDEVAVG